jgi:hypothetical protein
MKALQKSCIQASVIAAALASAVAIAAPYEQPLVTPLQPPSTHLRPLPDLEFRVAWLQAPVRNVRIYAVPEGKSYRVCFKVRNIGAVASGPYRIGAGGLGIPVAPFIDYPGLAPGVTQSGCIHYPTTPPAGSYNLGLKADSLNVVAELREDNNETVIPVPVVPR